MQTATTTSLTDENLKFDYLGRAERLAVDAQSILVQKRQEPLKIKKNISQLYYVLKRKHEKRNQAPTSEAILRNNVLKLTQIGIATSDMERAITQEKYLVSQQKEETEFKQPNQFVTTLADDTDIRQYLTKYTDFMLFNLVNIDSSKTEDTLPWDRQCVQETQKRWEGELKKLFDKFDVREERGNLLALGSKVSSKPVADKSQSKYGLNQPRREYYSAISNYINHKYVLGKKGSISVFSLIDQFAKISSNTPEINELWKILGCQVGAIELNEKQDPLVFDESRSIASSRDETHEREKTRALVINLVKNTCKILEEEYMQQVRYVSKNSQHYRYRNSYGVNEDVMAFIQELYLNEEFLQANYLKYDSTNFPVWAVCYFLFRAGKLEHLKEFLNKYNGSFRDRTQKFLEFYLHYLQSKEYLQEDIKIQAIQAIESGSEYEDVFEQSLYFLISRHAEIPSDDLIAKLGDYLWFNLKVCDLYEEDDKQDEISDKKFLNKKITLKLIQETILSYGAKHFNAGSRNPLTYIKTLFIVLCHDEAFESFKEGEPLAEDLFHFAVVLKESNLIALKQKWRRYFDQGTKYPEFLNDAEYEKLVTNYAMSISASNPLEAVLYLKLLKHQKDLVDTVSSFIISNEQVWFFFDKHRDSLRNAKKLQEILGLQAFKDVVLKISKSFKKNNLEITVCLIDLIEDFEQVLSVIIDEEYKNTKELINPGFDETQLKTPIRKLFDDILEKYRHQGVTKNYSELYSALGFIKKVQEISIMLGKRKYQEALNYLQEWRPFLIETSKAEKFKRLHEKVQLAYLDLIKVCARIIREHYKSVIANYNNRISKEVVAKTVESDKNTLVQIDEFFKNIKSSVQFNRDTVLATIRALEDELTQARTDLLY